MHRMITVSRALVGCMAVALCTFVPMLSSNALVAASDGPPQLIIVVGEKAPELERMAADELSAMLGRLFEAKVEVGFKPDDAAAAVILLGQPATNSFLAEAVAGNWPKLTDQGIVLRRLETVKRVAERDLGASTQPALTPDPSPETGEGSSSLARPTLVVGGGSPVATLWAAYELGERLGIRYLHDRDVYPQRKALEKGDSPHLCRAPEGPFRQMGTVPFFEGLPELDLVMEPNMRIRCWRLLNEHAYGSLSWSLEENRRFLRQMAKMKYNRVYLGLWPWHPFVQYTFRGMPKPPGVLFFGQKYPIDEDTIGREKFPDMKFFTNPELANAEEPQEIQRRAVGLVHGILEEAKKLGMQTGLSIQPFEWPKEFMEVLPGSELGAHLGDLAAGPGRNQSPDDPLLQEMIATIIRAYVETYPDADYLHIDMPESRHWTGLAHDAYQQLCSRYGVKSLGSFEELCARARSRTTFPGGGERVEMQVKGDLVALCFLDTLLREKHLLRRAGNPVDIKFVYQGVSEELFPLVARMLPPGGELLSLIDYTASRVVRQRDLLRQAPPKNVPANLIFTLADDNVGVLPQLATGSLHTLLGELRANSWAGFYTRYWTVSEQDPAIHYLARASWDSSMTPEQAYADQISHVCGPEAVNPAMKALAIIEQITLDMDEHGLGFGFTVPGMMTKNYDAEGLSPEIKGDHEQYREALHLMQQARQRSCPEGREYLDYYVGRLRFAVCYLDAAEEYGATARAEKAGNQRKALEHAEAAYRAIHEALLVQADVARDHGDLGGVAVMNEYCYRPIRDKRNQLRSTEARK